MKGIKGWISVAGVLIMAGVAVVRYSDRPNRSLIALPQVESSNHVREIEPPSRASTAEQESPSSALTPLGSERALSVQEQLRKIQFEIERYENILSTERAIDRLNHERISPEERKRYFDIIQALVSLRLQSTDLKIQAIENGEPGV